MALTTYGEISPRTAAYVVAELLKRAMPYLVLEKFGQSKSLPGNSTQSMKFRRYNALATTGTRLTEGVTPAGKKLTATDITAALYQDGDFVEITDIIADTHEDAVQHESMSIVAEQAAKVVEINRYDVLKAMLNVFYANSVSARTGVLAVLARTDQRKIVRSLKRQEARQITQIVKSTPAFNQESILPAFVGVTHTDLTTDIRQLTGFTSCVDYGSIPKWETEVGSCEDVRYLTSTIFEPYEDGGSGTTTGKLTTNGVACDVYPVMYFGRDAYGIIALKGKFAITPMVLNPNTPRGGDPLGQRGSIGWKTMQGTVILNDAWCACLEVACTD
jgi:N4-gp56 family major capsid protein